MIYLDSNVFIYAALSTEEIGDRARALLKEVQEGKVASSSTLTFDELVWVVKKHRSLDDAMVAGEAFLNMPGLLLISVDTDILASALDNIRKYRLDPRDAIHAASAISSRSRVIVSTDEHFDKVLNLKREPL